MAQDTRVQNAFDDVAGNVPQPYRGPTTSQTVPMTTRATSVPVTAARPASPRLR